ncbi:hypothetical protein [Pseudoleptotrichia goodfellowii]|nr:hypothetical protein [Pseudoleptotrichia goodfellowii]
MVFLLATGLMFIEFGENIPYLDILIMVLGFIVMSIARDLFYRNIANKIENKNDADNGIKKVLIFNGIAILVLLGNGIIFYCILISGLENILTLYRMLIIICVIIIIQVFIYCLFFIYFTPLYLIRNLTFSESLKYNFHLCKSNKARIFFPMLITEIPILAVNSIFNRIPYLGSLLNIGLSVFGNIFIAALMTIIYLNVEYMDRKKDVEKTEKDISDEELI